MLTRRVFLGSLGGGLLAAPIAAEAQQAGTIPRIGVLSFDCRPAGTKQFDPNDGFREGLRSLGYVEGRNVVVEWRCAERRPDQLDRLATELARLKPNAIFAGGPVVLEAAMRATKSIPIVAVCCSNPVREGWAQSLARPGGNVTGLTVTFPETNGKRLELLKELVPTLSRVAVLVAPTEIPNWDEVQETMKSAARILGLQLQILKVRGAEDFAVAFSEARKERAQALVTIATAKLLFHQAQLSQLATHAQLPIIDEFKTLAQAGFLMTYGADLNDLTRRAAAYVDKILNGAKPAELPIEQPTKFELVINLKTAKALGLTIPPSLLARADEVIQ